MKPSRAARQCDSRRRRAERCHHYALYHRTVFLTWQNHRRHPLFALGSLNSGTEWIWILAVIYLSWMTCAQWGRKPNKRKTWDPENGNADQKQGRGNAEDDHKRKSQSGSYNVPHVRRARQWAAQRDGTETLRLDVTALAGSRGAVLTAIRRCSRN